jgi:hypothetical protein
LEPDEIRRVYGIEESFDEAIGLNAMFHCGRRPARIVWSSKDHGEGRGLAKHVSSTNASQLIFMLPGSSASALWELRQIASSP